MPHLGTMEAGVKITSNSGDISSVKDPEFQEEILKAQEGFEEGKHQINGSCVLILAARVQSEI